MDIIGKYVLTLIRSLQAVMPHHVSDIMAEISVD